MKYKEKCKSECVTFSRYLMGQVPDQYILRKYEEAFGEDRQLSRVISTRFEKMLLSIAIIHPILTHFIDVYSRFFYVDSVVRKRLVLLLAILETWGPSSARLEVNKYTGKIAFILGLIGYAILSGFMLVLAVIVLYPMRWIMEPKSRRK